MRHPRIRIAHPIEIDDFWQQIRDCLAVENLSLTEASEIYGTLYTVNHVYHRRFLRIIYSDFSVSKSTLSQKFTEIHERLIPNYIGYRNSQNQPVSDNEIVLLRKISVASCIVAFPNYFDSASDTWNFVYNDVPRARFEQFANVLIPQTEYPFFVPIFRMYRELDDGTYPIQTAFDDLKEGYIEPTLYDFA